MKGYREMGKTPRLTYGGAGVNIANANRAVAAMKPYVQATFGPNVLSDVGNFGGLYKLVKDLKNPVLVSSTDGVGTKIQAAIRAKRHSTVGVDLFHHCLDDLVVQGPVKPLFFLDYFGSCRLDPSIAEEVIAGLCGALEQYDCALLGGETAEMPGTYVPGQYDLVGTIVGIVERSKIIDGSTVVPGDVLLGLASGGLGTNGFTLARKTIFGMMKLRINSTLYTAADGTKVSVADELLRVHRCYYHAVFPLMEAGLIKAASHTTGGGIPGNLVRVLPRGVSAWLDRPTWAKSVSEVFDIIRVESGQGWADYFRTYNDEIGMILVVDAADASRIIQQIRMTGQMVREIGWIEGDDGSDPSVWIRRTGKNRSSFKCYAGSK